MAFLPTTWIITLSLNFVWFIGLFICSVCLFVAFVVWVALSCINDVRSTIVTVWHCTLSQQLLWQCAQQYCNVTKVFVALECIKIECMGEWVVPGAIFLGQNLPKSSFSQLFSWKSSPQSTTSFPCCSQCLCSRGLGRNRRWGSGRSPAFWMKKMFARIDFNHVNFCDSYQKLVYIRHRIG